MRVCVPTETDGGLDAPICSHFGRAPFFTVVDTQTHEVVSLPNRGHHHGGTKTPAEVVVDHGVDVLLAGNLGPRAVQMFRARGILVFTGASGSVADALAMHEAGRLPEATEESACQDHQH